MTTTHPPRRNFGVSVPFIELIGIVPVSLEPGRVEARLPFRAELTNTTGHIHGGMLMSVLDFVMSVAARSHDPDHLTVSTIEMHTSFISAAAGELGLVAVCLRQGRSIAFCEAEAKDVDGKTLVRASATFSVRRKTVPSP